MADAFRPIDPKTPAAKQTPAEKQGMQQAEAKEIQSDDPLAKGLSAAWDILPPQVVVRRSMKKRRNMI